MWYREEKKGENIKGKIRGQPLVATAICRTIFIIQYLIFIF